MTRRNLSAAAQRAANDEWAARHRVFDDAYGVEFRTDRVEFRTQRVGGFIRVLASIDGGCERCIGTGGSERVAIAMMRKLAEARKDPR